MKGKGEKKKTMIFINITNKSQFPHNISTRNVILKPESEDSPFFFHIFSVSGCSLETTWDEEEENIVGKKKLKRGYCCESHHLISMTIKSRTLSSSGHT